MVVIPVDLLLVVWCVFFCCFFFVKFSVSLLIRIILNELYMVHCGCYCGNSL